MKVQIWYNIDCYADKFNRVSEMHEAYLRYKLPTHDEHEILVARGNSFAEARERVINLFKLLPPSEELDL